MFVVAGLGHASDDVVTTRGVFPRHRPSTTVD